MSSKKIAIIGLGGIARKAYLPVLGAQKDIEFLLYNRSLEPLQDVQARYRFAKGFTDLDELIRNEPTAAFVLTAPQTHFDIVSKLLRNGIDVLVEKPATLHAEQTRQLAELADEHQRILMVAFNRRYAPLHVKAKAVWADTPITMALFQKHRREATLPSLADHIIDDTIHQIDLLRFYCGEGQVLSTAQRSTSTLFHGAASVIQLDGGGLAMVATDLHAGSWEERYSLFGGQKSLHIEAFYQATLVQGADQTTWKESYASAWAPTLFGRGFVQEIEHFYACIETRQQPLTSAWDSVNTQLLAEELIRMGENN